MARESALDQAVQAAILASAHGAAFERVAAARQACERLGALSSGRWRSAARDLAKLEDDLERGLGDLAHDVATRAEAAGVDEEALWTAGDAAGLLDFLREDALDELEDNEDDGGAAARLLEGSLLYGVALLDDAEAANQGTTLLFAWADPLNPAVWPWEASWVLGEESDEEEDLGVDDELDLYATGDLQAPETVVDGVAAGLNLDRDKALEVLEDVALAVTRASLLAGAEEEDEEDEDDGAPKNGHV